ncbi:hypothetical protein Plec18167_003662 [Paecilomyces lecythidis]|uniref:Uncharacterized protein n=1 Tax=Paecilomyces lecythidis TaxID=3004212 RepID=A0ABR3XWZ6_9EURO
MKRPIAKVYAMTNLRNYEVLVESTEAVFFAKLGNLADQKKAFELSTWFHWFATDVILEITFGKMIGFLEKEEDVEGIIEMVEKRFWYVAVTGQMPWLDKVLDKNPLFGFYSRFSKKTSQASPILKFTLDQIAEHKKRRSEHPEKASQECDFLSRFLDIQERSPEIPDA